MIGRTQSVTETTSIFKKEIKSFSIRLDVARITVQYFQEVVTHFIYWVTTWKGSLLLGHTVYDISWDKTGYTKKLGWKPDYPLCRISDKHFITPILFPELLIWTSGEGQCLQKMNNMRTFVLNLKLWQLVYSLECYYHFITISITIIIYCYLESVYLIKLNIASPKLLMFIMVYSR